MSVLQLSAASGPVAHVLAAAVLYLHIGAGAVGLVSGAAAVITRKGSRHHRLAGKVFVLAMLVMALIGACVAPFLPVPERATMLAGVLTFYLVLTGFLALRHPGQGVQLTDIATLLISLGLLGTSALLMKLASASPTGTLDGQPYQAFLMFVLFSTVSAAGDVMFLLKGGYQGAMRLSRHIWRMCASLFIAAGSFFLGQQKVFPESLQNTLWLGIPQIAVLLVLLYWLGHTFIRRHGKAGRQRDIHLDVSF